MYWVILALGAFLWFIVWNVWTDVTRLPSDPLKAGKIMLLGGPFVWMFALGFVIGSAIRNLRRSARVAGVVGRR